MKVQIFGAGAIGCLFGYFIQKAGFDVVFVARGKQLEALQKELRITGLIDDSISIDARRYACKADVTFVTVKSYDTQTAAEQLAGKTEVVCTVQNGIGNEDILTEKVDNVVGGVTSYAANLVDYGVVCYAGEGITYLGDWKGEGASVVAEILKKAGMNVEVVEDIERKKWEKAVINATINPLTALLRVENGKIVEIEDVWNVAESIAKECEEVMKAMGYKLNAVELVREVATKTARNRSSMLQDIERGRRTEIEAITGEIVRKAKELGVETPVNELMLRLVRGLECSILSS
ncbi:ketopantoate reductase family protein [Archaeoglobus veneficus]|nr:2-dehydropantoate 2-reductase [Archaeoglobus veneficus]